MPFSVSSDVYRDPKKTKEKHCTCTLYLGTEGKKNLQLSSQQEASQRFCHLQKQQRCHAIGFTVDQWEGSIGGGVLREVEARLQVLGKDLKRNGNLAVGPDVLTLCVGARMDKRKYISERVSMCERCVCPNLFICCTGGAIATAWRCSVVSR